MNTDELMRRAAEFDYWFFPHKIGDGKEIRATEDKYSEMHYKKIEHILSPALDLICGGSLKGMRVLDCGCNSGFFSFECKRRGADYVLGLEGKDEYLQQANLLKDYFEYSDVEFKKADMTEIEVDAIGQFDVVLLMGIIYYLEDPIAFLRQIYQITKKAIVIDSETIFFENAVFHLVFQSDPPNKFGGLTEARLLPSVGAIKAMLYISGFKSFYVLESDKVGKEYTNCRIAMLASKEREADFESLEDKPFVLSSRLGRIPLSEYVAIDKDFQ